jgi:hypothetical protein
MISILTSLVIPLIRVVRSNSPNPLKIFLPNKLPELLKHSTDASIILGIAMLTNVTHSLATYFPEGEETLPVIADANVTIADAQRYQRLKRLNTIFPGIFWDRAYPDSQPESCTFAQLNVLEMATRVAARLSHYSPSNQEDDAFQRYFVTDGRVNGRWSSGANRNDYLNLLSNLVNVATFPTTGNPNGQMGQKHRVGYLCGRVDGDMNNCKNPQV